MWVWLFAAIISYAYDKRENILILSFVGSSYLTLLLGPTVQMRYIYPIMLLMIFYIPLNMSDMKGLANEEFKGRDKK